MREGEEGGGGGERELKACIYSTRQKKVKSTGTAKGTSALVPFKARTNAAKVTVKCRTSDGQVPTRYPCEFCTSEQRAHAIIKWCAEQSRGISRYLLTHSLGARESAVGGARASLECR